MKPARRDIEVVRGDLYEHVIEFTDDASEYTYRAQVRAEPSVVGAADATFTIDTTDLATQRSITLTLSPASTSTLDPTTVYRWDLQRLDESLQPTTLLAGNITVVQAVSR